MNGPVHTRRRKEGVFVCVNMFCLFIEYISYTTRRMTHPKKDKEEIQIEHNIENGGMPPINR